MAKRLQTERKGAVSGMATRRMASLAALLVLWSSWSFVLPCRREVLLVAAGAMGLAPEAYALNDARQDSICTYKCASELEIRC